VAAAPPRKPVPEVRRPTKLAKRPASAPARPKPAPPPEPKKYAPKKPGDIAWVYPVPRRDVSRTPLRNCPAVGEKGRVYAALGNTLYAIVEEDGLAKVLWEYPTDGHIPGSPSLGPDGCVRVHSNDGKLHCVNHDGDEAFEPIDVGEPLGWASPLADDDANTWVCAYGGGLLKIDPHGGRKRAPFFRSRQKFDSTGLIYKGIYYVGAEDGFVYAVSINGMRGRITWDHLAGQGKTEWFINSSPALTAMPSLVVAGRDEYLYAFHLNGKKLWKVHVRGQMLASPVVAPNGDVYVGVSLAKASRRGEGKLVCVGGEPHKVKWEYKAQGMVESTPVIGSDEIVYFGDNAGSVHAVDQDGNRQWLRNIGAAVRSAGTIYGPQRVVFGNDRGLLVGLKCSSQAVATGGWPKYMGTLGQSGTPPL